MNTDFLTSEDQRWVTHHMSLTRPNLDYVWDLFHKDLTDTSFVEYVKSDTPIDIRKLKDCRRNVDFDVEFDEPEYSRDSTERRELMSWCRPAKVSDYEAWLKGWSFKDKRVDYFNLKGKFSERSFYVLLAKPAYIPELYGANSVNLIVPLNVGISPDSIRKTYHSCSGHNNIYFMKNFRLVGRDIPSPY